MVHQHELVNLSAPTYRDVLDAVNHTVELGDDIAMDKIVQAIARVKKQGGQSTLGEMWAINEDLARQSEHFHNGTEQIRSWVAAMKENVVDLKRIRTILESLSNCVNHLENALEGCMVVVSRCYGVAQLPKELLDRIFTLARCEERKTRRDLSLVCRRFRDTIQANQTFWTQISNKYNPLVVDLHIVRSNKAGIAVVATDEEYGPRNIVAFLRKVVRHSRRVVSIDLQLFESPPNWPVMSQIHGILSGLTLPLLKEVTLKYPDPVYYIGDGSPESDEMHFYASWSAPSLCKFSSTNFMPRGNDSFKLAWLETCTFGDVTQMTWTPLVLSEYLVRQHSLQTLIITVPPRTTWLGDNNGGLAGLPMEALRHLHITAESRTIYKILRVLAVPVLESLHISMTSDDNHLRNVFPIDNSYSAVKELQLICAPTSTTAFFAPFTAICSRFTGLERLVISNPAILTLPQVDPNAGQPPLRRVHFKCCYGLNEGLIEPFLEYISAGPSWDEFEELRITLAVGPESSLEHTRTRLRECVEEYLPPHKLVIEGWDAMCEEAGRAKI